VKQILHRNNPVLWATGQGRPVTDVHMLLAFTRTATLWTELEKMKIPGIQSVCVLPESAGRFWAVVSVKQAYPGHSRQVADAVIGQQHRLLRHEGRHHGGRGHPGRRPAARDLGAVLPLRPDARHRAHQARPLDAARPGARSRFRQAHTSRILMDACIPYEWKEKPVEVKFDEATLAKVKGRWAEYGIG
jgi:3-polyprenyl-4-hydroxybenzoate decarboxylase